MISKRVTLGLVSRDPALIDLSDLGQRGARTCLPRAAAGVWTSLLGPDVYLSAHLHRHDPAVESMRSSLLLLSRRRRFRPAPDLRSSAPGPNRAPLVDGQWRITIVTRREPHPPRPQGTHRPTASQASTRTIQKRRAA